MMTVHHRYATVDGRHLFYREAGPSGAPAVVLLHCFPASSFMFRELIPVLADRYRVIAPDHLGFGLSDAPPAGGFGYTFDALAHLTSGLLRQLRITRYAMYVHDYGAPIGWRLALADPDAVTAIISLTLDMIRWQYLTGVPDQSLVSPDTWHHDHAQVSRPGNDLIQLDLFADYATNPRAEIHVLDGGRFLLESQLDATGGYIRGFLGRTLS
jgi:pimeloyl-ACP methyl ester carboxylesterase